MTDDRSSDNIIYTHAEVMRATVQRAIMSELLLSKAADGIAQLRLNRPQKRNAINLSMKNAIADALTDWGEDSSVRVLVISGEGQDFATGADVSELAAWTSVDHDRLQT